MKIVYLHRARVDLEWWRGYYEAVFQDGSAKAYQQFAKTLELLKSHPLMGHPVGTKRLREYAIPNLPFSLIYRIDGQTLVVVRVWDQRANRPASLRGGK